MKFRIEHIIHTEPDVALIVRQLDDGPWSFPESPRLAGIPIRRTIDQPRAFKPDGTPDLSLFVFFLIGTRQAPSFHIGQIAGLTG